MRKPEDINWDEAPAGTSACVLEEDAAIKYGWWRRFEGEEVLYWDGFEWKHRSHNLDLWKKANPHALKPEVKEAHLPHGLKWKEGYDYYNPECGGFFFDLEKYYHAGRESVWTPGSVEFWLKHHNTIHKYGKAKKPEVKKEQPKPKVGWW